MGAGLQHLLVDRQQQRRRGALAVDRDDLPLLHLGRVADQDLRQPFRSRIPHVPAPSGAPLARLRRYRHEQRVQPRVVGQLRVEGAGENRALAHRHRVALVGGEHLDPGAAALDPGRADEHRAQRLVADPLDLQVRLEALQLAAEGVAPRASRRAARGGRRRRRSSRRRCRRSAARPRGGRGSARSSPADSIPLTIVVLSPPGMTSPSSPSSSAGDAHLARLGAEPAQHRQVRFEAALDREDADAERRTVRHRGPAAARRPRPARRSPAPASPRRARPRPRRPARGPRSAWSPRRSPLRAARDRRS